MIKPNNTFIDFNGLEINSLDVDSTAKFICSNINDSNSKNIFIHLNMNNLYIIKKNIALMDIKDYKIHYFFEGIGFKIILYFLQYKWYNDSNGTDVFPKLLNLLNSKIFLLGATNTVIEKSAINIAQKFSRIKLSGFHTGYFDNSMKDRIVQEINILSPDLLILGRGMLKELEFINLYSNSLDVRNIWCVGGLFDFISGNKKRCPKLLRILRLEWLFRMVLEPSRMLNNFKVGIWFLHYAIKIKVLS